MKTETPVKPEPERWLAEFYPTPAEKTIGLPVSEIVQHSLVKWRGIERVTEFGLRKHRFYPRILHGTAEDVTLNVDVRTCSLCVNFYKPSLAEDEGFCGRCPVLKVNEGKNCHNLFDYWTDSGDAGPMVVLLSHTLEYALEQENSA